jgi:hypothetical protein
MSFPFGSSLISSFKLFGSMRTDPLIREAPES